MRGGGLRLPLRHEGKAQYFLRVAQSVGAGRKLRLFLYGSPRRLCVRNGGGEVASIQSDPRAGVPLAGRAVRSASLRQQRHCII